MADYRITLRDPSDDMGVGAYVAMRWPEAHGAAAVAFVLSVNRIARMMMGPDPDEDYKPGDAPLIEARLRAEFPELDDATFSAMLAVEPNAWHRWIEASGKRD